MRYRKKLRAIFNWALKESGFHLVSSEWIQFTLWLAQKTRTGHSINQSNANLKPITTWRPAFSRAWGGLVFFLIWALIGSKWYFPHFYLAVVITWVLLLRNSIEKRNISSNVAITVKGISPTHLLISIWNDLVQFAPFVLKATFGSVPTNKAWRISH